MTTVPPLYLLKQESPKKRLLVYFFTRPNAEHYLRELALLLRVDPANLSRDLQRLIKEGIFRSRTQGNLKFFSLNRNYSLYEEMRSMITKTAPVGVVVPLKNPKANAYVIAGPNGAGKTTFAKTFLPEYLNCKVFVNADLIAGGIAPFAPGEAAIKAGKLLLDEIRSTAKRGVDFGFETTLSGRSHIHLFRELIRQGYALHLFFLWLPSVEISLKRIRERVARGGHNIPEPVARRRFHRGIENLFLRYNELLASWIIFDNSGTDPKIIAYRGKEKSVTVLEEESFLRIKKEAGVL